MKVKAKDWLNLTKQEKIKMLTWITKEYMINKQAEDAEREFEDYIDNRY